MPHIYNEVYDEKLLNTPKCKIINIKYVFPYMNSFGNSSRGVGNNNNNNMLTNTFRRRSLQAEKKMTIHMLVQLEIVRDNEK